MSIYTVDEVIKTPGSSLSPGTHVHWITAVAAVTPKACLRFWIYTVQTQTQHDFSEPRKSFPMLRSNVFERARELETCPSSPKPRSFAIMFTTAKLEYPCTSRLTGLCALYDVFNACSRWMSLISEKIPGLKISLMKK
jgi:hypothetical protein